MKYWKYLKYLLRHKYYVAKICFRLGIWRQGILHDWSRFTPREFKALANYYYSGEHPGYFYHNGQDSILTKIYGIDKCAWWHQKLNRHHWDWWVMVGDLGDQIIIEMEKRFIKEMVADWYSASLVKTGKVDLVDWYEKKKGQIHLGPKTRKYLERLLPIVERIK